MDHSATDAARQKREARARKAERRRAIVDARIADAIWRARFIALDCEIAAIRAANEASLRADWRPAPPERARGCRLPACRRHGACQSDALRRVCGIPPTPTPEPLTWPEPRVPHTPGRNDTEPSLPPTPAPRANRPSLDDLLSQLSPDIRRTLARPQSEDTEDPQPIVEDEPEPAEDDDDGLASPRRYDPCDFRNYARPGAEAAPDFRTWDTGPMPDRPVSDRPAPGFPFGPDTAKAAPGIASTTRPEGASAHAAAPALPRCRFPG